jgi:hypothetical protein
VQEPVSQQEPLETGRVPQVRWCEPGAPVHFLETGGAVQLRRMEVVANVGYPYGCRKKPFFLITFLIPER